MNSIKQVLFILFGILVFTSCEDVVVLDLEEAEARLVIEGTIDVGAEEAKVLITRTNGFYETAVNEPIAGASVSLTNPLGVIFTLEQEADGAYHYSTLTLTPGEKYTLKVSIDGLDYTAIAEVPYPVNLDSLTQEKIDFPFGGQEEETYQIFANWTDTPNLVNFYRIKAFVDGEVIPNFYSLLNDELSDGNELTIPMREQFDKGTTVLIELRSVDEAYYNYFQKLSTVLDQGANSSNPFNPTGNFDQDVLGYFGIYHTSAIEIEL